MWPIWDYLFLFSKNLSDDTFLEVVFENPERLILDCTPPPNDNNKQTKRKPKGKNKK